MIKISFVVLVLLSSSLVWADDIAFVSDVKGNAFAFYQNGSSRVLKAGSRIPDFSDIMVEDGSTLSLTDYKGHSFHLSGGSQIKLFKNLLELKTGKVWVYSANEDDQFVTKTMNSEASFDSAQFVLSFDSFKGKSQLLVLDGVVTYNNHQQPSLSVDVPAGNFSLVSLDYNNGLPRTPTKVGLKSYHQLKASFNGIEQVDNSDFEVLFGGKSKNVKRSIASVSKVEKSKKTRDLTPSRRGKIRYVSTSNIRLRKPSSVDGPGKYYKDIETAQKRKLKPLKTNKSATIRVFSVDMPEPPKSMKTRMPASIPEESKKVIMDINNSFEKSLNRKFQEQKKHPDEINSLIDELKTFKKSYSKQY